MEKRTDFYDAIDRIQRQDRYIEYIEEENKKLKEELGEYKKMFEDQLKKSYIKNTAKFLDKKFPKVSGFMEEDTLQELRDIGEIE